MCRRVGSGPLALGHFFFLSQMGFPSLQFIFTDSSKPLPSPQWEDDLMSEISSYISCFNQETRTKWGPNLRPSSVNPFTQTFRWAAWEDYCCKSLLLRSSNWFFFHLGDYCTIKVSQWTQVNICYFDIQRLTFQIQHALYELFVCTMKAYCFYYINNVDSCLKLSNITEKWRGIT